ncbi:MAG TPA: hypothetical protein DIV39_04615 [Verrucomicrobiales bacterium]|nr:hypothetical protein [Verrucomicrobiales bacterium]
MLSYAVILIPLLVGAVLLVRAVKNWATITLLVGASCLTLAPLLPAIAFLISSGLGRDGLSYVFSGMGLAGVAGVAGVGLLGFAAGAVGVGIKYSATVRRAKELEVLLQQVQERIDSGERT